MVTTHNRALPWLLAPCVLLIAHCCCQAIFALQKVSVNKISDLDTYLDKVTYHVVLDATVHNHHAMLVAFAIVLHLLKDTKQDTLCRLNTRQSKKNQLTNAFTRTPNKHTHTYAHMCMHSHTHTHMQTYKQAHILTCTHTHIHTHTHIYMHTHTDTYTLSCTYTHAHIHAHTHTT